MSHTSREMAKRQQDETRAGAAVYRNPRDASQDDYDRAVLRYERALQRVRWAQIVLTAPLPRQGSHPAPSPMPRSSTRHWRAPPTTSGRPGRPRAPEFPGQSS